MAKKGDWVRIKNTVLKSEERAENIPADTREKDLNMWVKGYLLEDGSIGEEVRVKTYIGREVQGELVEVEPYYRHSFGKFIPETLYIGRQAREILRAGEDNE